MKIDDSSLIDISPNRGAARFIIGVMLIFALLTLAWVFGSSNFIERVVPLSFTTNESNLAKVAKELNHPNAQIVLVGTSVMDRIDPQFFKIPGVVNLALEGGSSVTGLEIVSRGQVNPLVVYIETNFVSNHPNDRLLAETNGDKTSLILAGTMKPLRFLFSSKTYVDFQGQEDVQDRLLSEKPKDYNNAVEVQKGVDWYNSDEGKKGRGDPAPMIARISEITSQLEAKGVRVFYVHVPLAEAYEETSFFRGYRAAIAGSEKYHCARCLDIRDYLKASELRWGDGIHLDNRSAAMVAKVIEAHFLSLHLAPK